MAFGTASIAFLPGYATLGLLAPLLILIGRLVQGFSAGMELGGVSVYLAENRDARPSRLLHGVAIGKPAGSRDLRRGAGRARESSLNAPADGGWGWRIPLIAGCVLSIRFCL